MTKVAAGAFKAKCLHIMDEVKRTREEVVVTKHGKPVVKIVPMNGDEPKRPIFGFMKDSVSIHGDIVEGTGEGWDADA